MTLLEVCLDDIGGAATAEQRGADRIELCADLADGGTTPSIGTVRAVLGSVSRIGVNVLIRQRGGDFVYSEVEVQAMCADIEAVRALTAPAGVEVGFVIGALLPDGRIDTDTTSRMLRACGTASVTFHKAFDQTPSPAESLETLVDLDVARVLTSGGPGSVVDNVDALSALVAQADGRIGILAGGGLRAHNAASTVVGTGVSEVHFRAGAPVPSASLRASAYDPGTRMVTSGDRIDEMLAALSEVPAVSRGERS
ncbi:copper homeostasis protein CutC [Glaciibacter superstes]|uniref:copper homeostasis protein CutC n=1 Tax=Glaciibacter superstes TaxID=501023 RepID=UPI0003B30D8A|nr:copper homeostasis protein CutC [Glaciibacter superstes]